MLSCELRNQTVRLPSSVLRPDPRAGERRKQQGSAAQQESVSRPPSSVLRSQSSFTPAPPSQLRVLRLLPCGGSGVAILERELGARGDCDAAHSAGAALAAGRRFHRSRRVHVYPNSRSCGDFGRDFWRPPHKRRHRLGSSLCFASGEAHRSSCAPPPAPRAVVVAAAAATPHAATHRLDSAADGDVDSVATSSRSLPATPSGSSPRRWCARRAPPLSSSP